MESRNTIDTADDVGKNIKMHDRGRFECETGIDEHEPFAHDECLRNAEPIDLSFELPGSYPLDSF